nr:hypothetical protein CFP56_21244 [Quercus suber]
MLGDVLLGNLEWNLADGTSVCCDTFAFARGCIRFPTATAVARYETRLANNCKGDSLVESLTIGGVVPRRSAHGADTLYDLERRYVSWMSLQHLESVRCTVDEHGKRLVEGQDHPHPLLPRLLMDDVTPGATRRRLIKVTYLLDRKGRNESEVGGKAESVLGLRLSGTSNDVFSQNYTIAMACESTLALKRSAARHPWILLTERRGDTDSSPSRGPFKISLRLLHDRTLFRNEQKQGLEEGKRKQILGANPYPDDTAGFDALFQQPKKRHAGNQPIGPVRPRIRCCRSSDASEQPDDQEPTRTDESHAREDGDRVQHYRHVNRRAVGLDLLVVLLGARHGLEVLHATDVQHYRRQCQVAEHPGEHDGAAEPFVVVFVLLLGGDDFLRCLIFGAEHAQLVFVLGVQIGIVGWDGNVNFATGFCVGCWKFLRLVVTLSSPSNVMGCCRSSDASEQPDDQEPTRTDESHAREDGDRVQHYRHVNRRAVGLDLLVVLLGARHGLEVLHATDVQHYRRQCQVAEHPGEHDGAAEPFVVVFVLLLGGDDFLRCLIFGAEHAQLVFVLGVQIGIVGWDGNVNFATGFCVGCWKFLRLVVTLSSPSNVMGVAEGIHVQDVDISGREEEVLDEGGKHVPRVEEEDGGDEVENPGRCHRDDEGAEYGVREEQSEREAVVLRDRGLHRFDRDENGGEEQIDHQHSPEVDLGHVEPATSLRSITKSQNETGNEGSEIKPFE